ncbi:hypothetical protein AGMMS50268_14690 [Spirochaetia bacterium]|nr:hypothetical protein AGMMS50268_14690 [Spirochaetia bacterium]
MECIDKGESYKFDKDFKNLPMENRVKLINTAKSLLAVQKASRDTASLADTPTPLMEVEKQGLA